MCHENVYITLVFACSVSDWLFNVPGVDTIFKKVIKHVLPIRGIRRVLAFEPEECRCLNSLMQSNSFCSGSRCLQTKVRKLEWRYYFV